MSYKKKLYSVNWQKKRLLIMERDGWRCARCGSEGILHVHHKNYIVGRKPWEYSDDNFITLCEDCHAYEHGLFPDEDQEEVNKFNPWPVCRNTILRRIEKSKQWESKLEPLPSIEDVRKIANDKNLNQSNN